MEYVIELMKRVCVRVDAEDEDAAVRAALNEVNKPNSYSFEEDDVIDVKEEGGKE
jgi:hypothetical protein